MSQHLINQLFQLVCPEQQTKDPDEMLIQVISQIKHPITEQNYFALEKQVQKYESEIRKHIRVCIPSNQMEQQIKLYAESLQSKLEEQEQFKSELMSNSKSLINSLKRENQELYEQIKIIQEENKQLRIRLLDRSPDITPSPMHDQHTVKVNQYVIQNNIKYTTIDFNPQKKRLSKQNDDISMNHEIKTQISHTIDSSNIRQYHPKQSEKISKSKQSDLRPDPRQFRQYISQQSRTLSQQQKQPIAQQILNKAPRQQSISIQQDPRFALKSEKQSDYSTIISNTQTNNFIYPKKKTERSDLHNKQGKSISEHQSLMKRSLHMNEHVASQDYTEYLEQDIQ